MDQKIYDTTLKLVKTIIEREAQDGGAAARAALDGGGSFMESLAVDSLLALEIVSKIEKRFNIKFQEEDFTQFTTLENIVGLIEKKLNKKQGKIDKKTAKKQAKKTKTGKSIKKKTKKLKKTAKKIVSKKRKPSSSRKAKQSKRKKK
ncbi:MAG: acyl carrier protein [Candidatus Omnitrophota bacterium]